MDEDMLFRVILAVLAIALHLNHRLYGRRFPETEKIGGIGEICLTATACLWAMSLLVYVTGSDWFDFSVPLPYCLRWAGIVLMALCIPLSIWIYRTLGVHFSTKLQLLKDHQLVRSGPYRWVRHPMYATFFLCALSTSIISANLIVTVLGAAVIATMAFRSKKEEMMLVERFDGHYREYMEKTGAFVPKIRSHR